MLNHILTGGQCLPCSPLYSEYRHTQATHQTHWVKLQLVSLYGSPAASHRQVHFYSQFVILLLKQKQRLLTLTRVIIIEELLPCGRSPSVNNSRMHDCQTTWRNQTFQTLSQYIYHQPVSAFYYNPLKFTMQALKSMC